MILSTARDGPVIGALPGDRARRKRMSKFEGFHELPFMEQIVLLGEVERAAEPSDIDALQELFAKPVGDAAVDTMVRNALRALLLKHPEALLQGLESDRTPYVLFYAGLAGESELAQAVPLLMRLARERADDPDSLQKILTALGRIGSSEAVELFREHMGHPDDFISSLCIERLGLFKDDTVLPELEALINANEEPERYEQCDMATWKAIEALAAFGTPQALEFLASKLHHENPTARRLVHRGLVEAGDAAVPHVAAALRQAANSDEKIMALNVLGFSGSKNACAALINAFDDGLLPEINERFAAYESLGRVPGMKGLIFLEDALWSEQDPLLLMAVVKALDTQSQTDRDLAQALAKKIAVRAKEDQGAVQPLLDALVAAGAATLFAALHGEAELAASLLQRAAGSLDAGHLEDFALALEEQADQGVAEAAEAAKHLREALEHIEEDTQALRLLAVDDSGAMRTFYRQAGVELGYNVATAENGQEALDLVEAGENFDLLVVDMNMPVMDGIEFISRLRALPDWKETPVIMASTESAKSQAQLAKKAGVDTFIVKPFTLDVFKNKIKKLLHGIPSK